MLLLTPPHVPLVSSSCLALLISVLPGQSAVIRGDPFHLPSTLQLKLWGAYNRVCPHV